MKPSATTPGFMHVSNFEGKKRLLEGREKASLSFAAGGEYIGSARRLYSQRAPRIFAADAENHFLFCQNQIIYFILGIAA